MVAAGVMSDFIVHPVSMAKVIMAVALIRVAWEDSTHP
jgi:hypothetical protein